MDYKLMRVGFSRNDESIWDHAEEPGSSAD